MSWKHPVEYLITAARAQSGLTRQDICHGRSDKAFLWRKAVCFVAVDKFLVSVGNVADHFETEQSTIATTYRKARQISDEEEFFCMANDIYQVAFASGARPVRANRQQKLERQVSPDGR